MTIIIACVFSLGLVPVTLLYLQTRERSVFLMKENAAIAHREIPPIDAAAPAKVGTATFALG